MNSKLDLKDRKILYELDLNSRQSNNQIAKKLKISKDVVNYRIKKFQEEGIIKYFVTVIDTNKLGYVWYRFYIKFYNLTPNIEKRLIEYLKSRVGWMVTAKGNWDLCFMIWEQDIFKLQDFWNKFYSNFGSYIYKHWFSVIPKIIHLPKGVILSKIPKKFYIWGGTGKKAKINNLDYKILKILSKNARMPSTEISNKLKTTEIVIRWRIKKMLKEGVILGFRPFIDITKLGIKFYKIHFYLKNIKKDTITHLRSYSQSKPQVIYIDETIGGADLEVEVYVKDTSEVYCLIDEIRKKFPNNIKDHEFIEYTKEYTWSYLPY